MILAEETYGLGIVDRPGDQKDERDYLHDEIAEGLAPAVWVEKAPADFFTVPASDQAVANDCVEHAYAKELGIENMNLNSGIFRKLSPVSVYPFVAIPGGGSSNRTAGTWIQQNGMTLDAILPGDILTETQATDKAPYVDDAKAIATIYKPAAVVFMTTFDFDSIAAIIDNYRKAGIKKGVGICIIGFNNGTWRTAFPMPPQSQAQIGLWYHKVIVTDFGLINGVKYLCIVNSWGGSIGMNGAQLLSQTYEPFIYSADYVTKTAYGNLGDVPAPSHTWTAALSVGARGPEVLVLQQALQSMGMFPSGSILKPTGYFGGITRNGVQMFQDSFGIPETGVFDAPTMARFNQIFGAQQAPAPESSAAGESTP